MGELLDGQPVVLRNDWHYNMKPLSARALEKAFQSHLFEQLTDLRRALGEPGPRYRRVRIEIDDDPVWMFQIVIARTPRMHLEHAHLCQPSQRLGSRQS